MLIDVGPEPRSPYGPDPVERARLRERLGHVQLRALQHALGDPERDPVDEVALPELERRGRRHVEAREVGQVAAERLPALGLGLRGRACAGARARRLNAAITSAAAFTSPQAPSAIRTTLLQRGATELKTSIPQTERQPAASDEDDRARRAGCARPMLRNHFRPETSAPTADLNDVKRSRVRRPVLLDPVAEEREPLRARRRGSRRRPGRPAPRTPRPAPRRRRARARDRRPAGSSARPRSSAPSSPASTR